MTATKTYSKRISKHLQHSVAFVYFSEQLLNRLCNMLLVTKKFSNRLQRTIKLISYKIGNERIDNLVDQQILLANIIFMRISVIHKNFAYWHTFNGDVGTKSREICFCFICLFLFIVLPFVCIPPTYQVFFYCSFIMCQITFVFIIWWFYITVYVFNKWATDLDVFHFSYLIPFFCVDTICLCVHFVLDSRLLHNEQFYHLIGECYFFSSVSFMS